MPGFRGFVTVALALTALACRAATAIAQEAATA